MTTILILSTLVVGALAGCAFLFGWGLGWKTTATETAQSLEDARSAYRQHLAAVERRHEDEKRTLGHEIKHLREQVARMSER